MINDANVKKPCPFCGEQILAIAKKCKHCQSMLDGSTTQLNVKIKESDPFAEYHTPIQGKKEGKLTFIGYLGIAIGILAVFASCSEMKGDGSENIKVGLLGIGFGLASYLWARKK